MLLIYTPSSSPRLCYIFDIIFQDILSIEYTLTHDAASFTSSAEPKISYAEQPAGDELFFCANKLLFENDIHTQDINVFDWEDTKAFFATDPKYIFPFDPFAASFYLISRYEEYLPYKKDKYGRFDAKESLAYHRGFLQQPIVNVWSEKIKKIINGRYPRLKFPAKQYQYISTIDIDNAFAYKEKGLLRTTGALLRSLVYFDLKSFSMRVSVLLGRQQDPYDTYDLLTDIQKKYNLKYIYFFLLGDYAEYDRGVPITSIKFQSLIKSIAANNEIGIHPSFLSNSKPEKLKKEINRLAETLQKNVTKSRQHFLKLTLPDTYRCLLEHGITDDYTMGYASDVGFRAGLCTPFYFYDLESERVTGLKVHPFAVMDATLNNYMKLDPQNALSYIELLVKEVKEVNGTFISLWHNESLSNKWLWKDWQYIYEEMVRVATK